MIHKIRKEILCIMICLKWHCKAQLMRIISILAGIIMEKKEKESIKNGYVDAIATDHAPHTPEDKANNAPGISGIETSFSLCHKVFTDNEISLKLLSKLLSASPARFLGLSPRVIRTGIQANLVVIEEKKSQMN